MSPAFSLEAHHRALSCGLDVPEQSPSFRLPLSGVGISGKTLWVGLPQGRLPFEAEITVDLPGHLRGIHMSRIEEAIHRLYGETFADLRDYALALGNLLLETQQGDLAKVTLSGVIPVPRRTLITLRDSVEAVRILAEVSVRRAGTPRESTSLLGLELCHITACPCTQVYGQNLAAPAASELPLPTHSQRSVTRLQVEDPRHAITYEDLLGCLEAALHTTQGLLKRPDEAEIVILAHSQPQFAEDAVRETARQAGLRLGHLAPPEAALVVDALSLESIHTHDVRCGLRTTLGDVLEILAKEKGYDARL